MLSDGRAVSGSIDHSVRVWNTSTGECVCVMTGHTHWITSLVALSDGRVVSGSNDSTLRLWDASTGKCVRQLEGHDDMVTSVAVLSDGRVVSGSMDNKALVWDLLTGESVPIPRLLDYVFCLTSVKAAFKSLGLPHVSMSCKLPMKSGLGNAGLAVGTDSGEMHFFTLLVSMDKL